MPDDPFAAQPVSRITVGTVGKPGQRTFLLQVRQDELLLTFKLEKEQAYLLAKSIAQVVEELEEREIEILPTDEALAETDMALTEPVEASLAVAQMGLVYDERTGLMLLVVQAVNTDQDAEELEQYHLWATVAQMRALSIHTSQVVSQGRPICPLCQEPIDPEGHFCPRHNGHS